MTAGNSLYITVLSTYKVMARSIADKMQPTVSCASSEVQLGLIGRGLGLELTSLGVIR